MSFLASKADVDFKGVSQTTPDFLTLSCIDRYLASRNGHVKKVKPPLTGFRLRCGDYRIFFDLRAENTIEITGVKHRSVAYR